MLIYSISFAELNLNPKYYKPGDIVSEDCISLSIDEWKNVVEEIKDLREENKLRKQQSENYYLVQKQYQDLLENSQLKIDLYKDNINLSIQERDLYRNELEKYQDKYVKMFKYNSYKTGFTFVLGISTAIMAGWAFSQIAR
jgi:hypothetical protein